MQLSPGPSLGAPRRPTSLPVLVLLLGASACADPGAQTPSASEDSPLTVVEDTVDGIPRVTSSGVAPRWRLDPVLTLGSTGGAGEPAPDEFGQAVSVAVGPTGNLWVADVVNHEIRVFRPDGTLERSVGREGEGPGEFGSIFSIAWAGDVLLVLDFGNGRIGEVSPTGEWLGTRPAPGRVSGSPATLRLYPVGSDEVYEWSIRAESGLTRVWVRHNPEGWGREYAQHDAPDFERGSLLCERSGSISFHSNPFAPDYFQHLAPDGRA